MSYRLFLDDIRVVSVIYKDSLNTDFVVVRSYDDFVAHIIQHGLPDFISFDNDLGEDESGNLLPDGYACAKWLVYESGLNLIDLQFFVHSANPVAKVQIQSLLNNYLRFLKNEKN